MKCSDMQKTLLYKLFRIVNKLSSEIISYDIKGPQSIMTTLYPQSDNTC